jgi:hypothetical protein
MINQGDPKKFERDMRFKGIFDKNIFLSDPWFNKDNFKELTTELDKFNLQDRSNKMKVLQFIFTTQKSFKFSYIYRPPTIENLEKYQFQKNYQGLTYLFDLINSKVDLNIGI